MSAIAGQVLAFDFDGVIADSMPPQEACWRTAVERVLGPEAIEAKTQIRKNLFEGKAGNQIFAGLSASPDKMRQLRATKDKLWDAASFDTSLMPGAKDAIARLAKRFRLAIATTAKRPYVEHLLTDAGIIGAFDVVVTNADVEKPKPWPDMLVKVATHFAEPINCLCMIGDSASDFEMANRAGTEFLWFQSAPNASPLNVPSSCIVRSWQDLEAFFT